jgi:voltage-gated potassium channel
VYRWLMTLKAALQEPQTRGPLAAAFLLVITGTIFYQLVEHWTFVDALYFSVTTLTTVGFGNPAPSTDLGKLFTVFFVISGVGMFLAVINAVGKAAVEQGIARPRRRGGRRLDSEEAESRAAEADAAIEAAQEEENEEG